jgi:isoleucyl-tRNA synthetase
VKDRLYCDRKDSLSRRAAQTVMYEILMSLIKMMAPVLSFTAEDIYKRVASGSVFHQKLPEPNPHYLDRELEDRWEKIIEVRGEAYKKIEELRIAKTVGQPLECDVRIEADDKLFSVLKSVEAGLAEILMVSSVRIEKGAALSISASKTDNKKCVRCWRYFPEINSDGICKRCEGAV